MFESETQDMDQELQAGVKRSTRLVKDDLTEEGQTTIYISDIESKKQY
jgi:hypothetical protein